MRCYTPDEVIRLLQTGRVTEISPDHDLGLLDGEREATDYDVLLWIEREVALAAFRPPLMNVQSANIVAHERMLAAIRAINRLAGLDPQDDHKPARQPLT